MKILEIDSFIKKCVQENVINTQLFIVVAIIIMIAFLNYFNFDR